NAGGTVDIGAFEYQIAPAISSSASTSFTVGIAGNFTVSATGYGAPTLSLSGQPAWLSINSTTGLMSGTPPLGSSGKYTFTITASNGTLSDATQIFTLTVNAANVTSQVRLLWPASYVSLGNHEFRGVFTVKNNSTQTLKNVQLFWPKLPKGVSVFSSTKISSLAPGASATISVVFLDLSAYPLGSLKLYFPAQVVAG